MLRELWWGKARLGDGEMQGQVEVMFREGGDEGGGDVASSAQGGRSVLPVRTWHVG